MPPLRGEGMTDTPPRAVPLSGHRSWSTHPTPSTRTVGAADLFFFLRFQHAPHGVDVQDLRPLRGRPCGPIPDTDAYRGAPTDPHKKIQTTKNEVDRPRPFQG
jgi:hypothetical protein